MKDINIFKREASLIKDILHDWEGVVFIYEDDFLKTFCKGDAWTLTEVTWNSNSMKFVYIIDGGSHIVNSVPMNKWLNWYYKKVNKILTKQNN